MVRRCVFLISWLISWLWVSVAYAEIHISGRDVEGRPGERIAVPFDVEITEPLASNVTLYLSIRARASVLLPEGAYRWIGSRDVVRFVNVTLQKGSPTRTRFWVDYTCVLGDSLQIAVRIHEVRQAPISGVPAATIRVLRHSRLTLVGVCGAGGRARLFDPWNRSTSSTRDPAQGVWDVQGRHIADDLQQLATERGATEFAIQRCPRTGALIVP